MMEIPRERWKPSRMPDGAPGPVQLQCPDCAGWLALGHQIAADGVVHPSVVCTHLGCRFHEFVKLQGWPARRASTNDTSPPAAGDASGVT